MRKVPEALLLVDRALADGKDVRGLMKDWMAHYRNLMITKFIRDPEDMLNMAAENLARIEEQSRHITMNEIRDAILRLSRTINEARWSTQPRILLELAIISIASGESAESPPWQSGKQYGARTSQQARTINPEQEAREQTARIGQGQAQALAEAATKPGATHGSGADRQQAETQTRSGIAGEKQELPQAPGMRDEIAPRTQAQTQSLLSSAENEALWHAVFEEGEDDAGSFNLIRNGTFLARVSETEFEVVAKTSFAKRFAEQKRGQLESIMERKLGRGLRMICVEEKDYHALQERQGMDETCAADGSVPDPETEHLMQLAKDALGIEIEIE